MQKLAKLFGAQDVQIGDEVFDNAFRITATNRFIVSAVLTDAVRKEILALCQRQACHVRRREARRDIHRSPSSRSRTPNPAPEWLDRLLRLVVEIARVHERSGPYR